jgi:hypothetical protein
MGLFGHPWCTPSALQFNSEGHYMTTIIIVSCALHEPLSAHPNHNAYININYIAAHITSAPVTTRISRIKLWAFWSQFTQANQHEAKIRVLYRASTHPCECHTLLRPYTKKKGG